MSIILLSTQKLRDCHLNRSQLCTIALYITRYIDRCIVWCAHFFTSSFLQNPEIIIIQQYLGCWVLPAIIPDVLAEGSRGTNLIQVIICYNFFPFLNVTMWYVIRVLIQYSVQYYKVRNCYLFWKLPPASLRWLAVCPHTIILVCVFVDMCAVADYLISPLLMGISILNGISILRQI